MQAAPLILGLAARRTASNVVGKVLGKDKSPTVQTPAAPTLDDARSRRDEADRIRRRRGVLANIVGGSTASSTPTVATKTLLGGTG